MHKLLSKLESAADLHGMNTPQLTELAAEIRDVLCNLLSERTAHFASNLGVVELCLALHNVFDFRRDRLIWGFIRRPANWLRRSSTIRFISISEFR